MEIHKKIEQNQKGRHSHKKPGKGGGVRKKFVTIVNLQKKSQNTI